MSNSSKKRKHDLSSDDAWERARVDLEKDLEVASKVIYMSSLRVDESWDGCCDDDGNLIPGREMLEGAKANAQTLLALTEAIRIRRLDAARE